MKNKKGFTLIELLAVIVILGIIMVIAVPAISRFIAKSKIDSLKSSADAIVRAAELYRSGNEIGDKVVKFSIVGGEETGANKLNYKGKIDSGTVMIYGEDEIAFCVTSDRYTAIKNINDDSISVNEGSCSFNEETQAFEAKEYCSNYKDQIANMKTAHQEKLYELTQKYESQIDSVNETYTMQIETLNQTITNLSNQYASNKKVVLLGTGAATYDVTSYPGYQNFTADNFIVEGHYGTGTVADYNRGSSATAYTGKSYNATTGKLTVTNGSASGDVSNSNMKYLYAYTYVNKVYLVY